jgi:signal transduction histidine kinase
VTLTTPIRRARVPSPFWVLLGASALVVGTLASAIAHRVDASLHDGYQDRVSRLVTLQHRLNEQVLRAHAGLTGSYDPLVRTTRELRDLHRELSVVPAYVSRAGRDDVLAHLERSRAVLATQDDLVERFKSRNAVLLNSLRYFPVAAAELAEVMATEVDESGEAVQLGEALRGVLRVAVFPTEDAVAQTTAQLRAIRPSGPHAESVRLLLRHASVITEERPAVDALLGQILAQPGESTAAELAEAYATAYEDALAAAQGWVVLFLATVALGILAVAASLVLRLREDGRVIAEASNKLATSLDRQNRFVSMTSHEFRTPLSVIVSSAELLLAYGERWGPEQHRKHLGRIERAGRAMTDLLDGILLIGRTDAGHRDFRPVRVDVNALAGEVVDNQRARARDGVTIELAIEGEGRPVLADPRLLKHALDNLVSNAVKYSRPKGRVGVRVAVAADELRLVVEDDGVGIPAEDQERLFDTFHRASNVGHIPGTGLGLAIVKRAIDLHGGRVRIESRVGEGSRFDASIPVGVADDDVEASGESEKYAERVPVREGAER